MSFAEMTNILTIILCLSVLVQSVRMMRSLKTIKTNELKGLVGALDTATGQARLVLSQLRETLSTDGTANVRTLAAAREIREELDLMIGIANSMAERLVEAASTPAAAEKPRAAKPVKARKEAKAEAPPVAGKEPAAPRRPRAPMTIEEETRIALAAVEAAMAQPESA